MANDRGRDAPESAEHRENGDTNGHSHGHGHESTPQTPQTPQTPRLYRLNSNQSSVSIFEDVEMAHDEVGGHAGSARPRAVSECLRHAS